MLKLYDVVRTVHLERLSDDDAVTLLYRRRKYDFHPGLVRGRDIHRAGALGALRWALMHRVDVIEISEPLIARDAARSLAAVVGNRVRAAATGRRPATVVTYAISSVPPKRELTGLPLRARLRWRLQWTLVPLVWRRVDRVAFGTELAMSVYADALRGAFPHHRYVPALPAARATVDTATVRPASLVFLGDLSARKGFPQVIEAWPAVRASVPTATLTILGKGAMEPDASALAACDASVRTRIDPSREEIFSVLEASKVLVLPSQPTSRWREQVGLPIVEGLASGCLIVTTGETGIADWLEAHGHTVVDTDDDLLSAAISDALRSDRTPGSVLADLPPVDGRMDAERWLFEVVR